MTIPTPHPHPLLLALERAANPDPMPADVPIRSRVNRLRQAALDLVDAWRRGDIDVIEPGVWLVEYDPPIARSGQ